MVASRLLTLITAGVINVAVAAAPPSISEPRLLPGDDALAGVAGEQATPDVAGGADATLVVWADQRELTGTYDVYGALVDSSGVPLGASFAIREGVGSQTRPRVAWNGAIWLVVYLSDGDLQAVRVGTDATVLDATPITIASPGSGAPYEIASDGLSFAVVWSSYSGTDGALRGARIGSDGAVLDPGGVEILPPTYFVRPLDGLAFCDDRYLAVWDADAGVVGIRLTPSLAKIDAAPITIAGGPYFERDPDVAGNGSEFYVTWTETDNSYWVEQLKGSRVTKDGVALVPAGTPINANKTGLLSADVTWDGQQWIAVWTGAGALANRVTADGSVLDGTGFQIASSATYADARDIAVGAPTTNGVLAIWQDYRSRRENDIWGARVSSPGTASTDSMIALSAPAQTRPQVVWNGAGYTVAFASSTSAGTRVLVQRLDTRGVPVDMSPVEVASAPDLVDPGLAWSGSRYLVTWQARATKRVYGRRLSPDLHPQDVEPISIMTGDEPAVAALGDVFLVVTVNSPSYWQWRDAYAQRVDGATGAPLGGLIGILGGFAWAPAVGTIGDRWMIAWEAHWSHNDTIYTLVHAWVDGAGVPTSSLGLITGSGWGVSGASIASHATQGALAFVTTNGSSGLPGETYLTRILADGTLVDGAEGLLVTGGVPGRQFAPAVTWNGAEYLVAFEDDRAQEPSPFTTPSDIYASRVGGGGTILDAAGGFPVETDPRHETQLAAAGAGSSTLLASSSMQGGEFASRRIAVRLLSPAATSLPPVDSLWFSSSTTMQWTSIEANNVYDMLRGSLDALRANRSIVEASCIGDDMPVTSADDTALPVAGDGYYYLVRADREGDFMGSYDAPGSPGQIRSRDFDAGPSACGHAP